MGHCHFLFAGRSIVRRMAASPDAALDALDLDIGLASNTARPSLLKNNTT